MSDDDFFDTPGQRRLTKWVVIVFGALLLLVLATPFIAVFTNIF
jgi:signal recognition particle receptor subunit beta